MEFPVVLLEYHVYWNGVIHVNLSGAAFVRDLDISALGRNPQFLNFLPNIFADFFLGFPVISGETSLGVHSVLKLIISEVWRDEHDASKDHRSQDEQG